MFNGLEVDMLSLGDADCLIITEWTPAGPHRVLIDGGNTSDAPVVRDFLRARNIDTFWAAISTHLHGDHAGGLIKLVKDKSITIHTGWMHDIRRHVGADTLHRASRERSSQAEGVREVVENTKELANAFASRGIDPLEPFAGATISGWPTLTVLGPTLPFYKGALREFTQAGIPNLTPPPALLPYLARSLPSAEPTYGGFLSLAALARPLPSHSLGSILSGVLDNSAIKQNPKTQPYNETSAILGCVFNGSRHLLTGDAGPKALRRIPVDWKNVSWMQVPHHGSDGNLSRDLIERFCPKFAYISACGDSSHPDRAIVSGLVKIGTEVYSTHQSGHLCHYCGHVPIRQNYSTASPLRGTGSPIPIFEWPSPIAGALR